tara:strand:- start:171 stop:467 length:297 start_codon:yes stop_codon:yes gene_type:complete
MSPYVYISIGLALLCFTLLYYLIKFSLLLIKIQESTEISLDILDEKYQSVSKILEMPVFFDSAEVRSVIADIEDVRDAILLVANHMTIDSQIEEKGDT